MSYSISIRAKTKQEAKKQINAKMADVMRQQPSHEADAGIHARTAHQLVDALDDAQAPGQEIAVSMNGSLTFMAGTTPPGVIYTSVSITVYYAPESIPV